jgi:hypothetical protein
MAHHPSKDDLHFSKISIHCCLASDCRGSFLEAVIDGRMCKKVGDMVHYRDKAAIDVMQEKKFKDCSSLKWWRP